MLLIKLSDAYSPFFVCVPILLIRYKFSLYLYCCVQGYPQALRYPFLFYKMFSQINVEDCEEKLFLKRPLLLCKAFSFILNI